MAISGPVWVLEEDGTIERFTKGVKDDFEATGLNAPIGAGSKIYAEPELDNVYILDVKNQRVVVFDDKGSFVTQYEGSFIKNSINFAIDDNTVYSFDL